MKSFIKNHKQPVLNCWIYHNWGRETDHVPLSLGADLRQKAPKEATHYCRRTDFFLLCKKWDFLMRQIREEACYRLFRHTICHKLKPQSDEGTPHYKMCDRGDSNDNRIKVFLYFLQIVLLCLINWYQGHMSPRFLSIQNNCVETFRISYPQTGISFCLHTSSSLSAGNGAFRGLHTCVTQLEKIKSP